MPGSLWIALLAISISVPIIAIITSFLRNNAFVGSRAAALTMACVLGWTLANLAEYASTGYEARMIWARVAIVPIAGAPLFWLIAATQFTGRPHLVRAIWVVPCSIFSLMLIVLSFTNERHHLVWKDTYLDAQGFLITHPGAWNFLNVGVSYSYSLIAVRMIVSNLRRHHGGRVIIVSLISLAAVTQLANILSRLLVPPFDRIDLTPFLLCLACLLYGGLLLSLRLLPTAFGLVPMVRDTVVSNMQDGMLVVDGRRRVLDANPAAQQMLGIGRRLRHEVIDNLHPAFANIPLDTEATREMHVRPVDGSRRTIEISAQPLHQLGQSVGNLLVLHDVTEQRRMEDALRKSEQRYRDIVNSVHEVIFQIDSNGCWQLLNQTWTDITGHAIDDCIGKPVIAFVHHDDRADVRAATRPLLAEDGGECRLQARILRHDGSFRYMQVTARTIHDETGARTGVNGTLSDVTERRALEQQLTHQAFHDSLTGLANRFQFHERVSHALSRVHNGRRDPLHAVLFLDLDNFKKINDSLGHDAGDQLLVEVGNRLRHTTRSGDTVARLGGDEFAILLEDMPDAHTAEYVAGEIVRRLELPIRIGAHSVFAGASVGVALSTGVTDASTILRHADIAMYAAKHGGRGRVARFTAGMDAQVRERVSLEEDMHRALQRNEFFLVYQPTVDLRTGAVIGTEALLRWQHPLRGLVPPAVFIPIAEESGLILDIGRWVCREACRQTREWQKLHPTDGMPLRIAVNLSARQFASVDLVTMVGDALAEAGLDPNDLTLELTESVIMQNTEATIERLDALKQLGVRLAVDDFGTGYSSLSYLQRFPIDVLKIDKTFVSGAGRGYGASTAVGERDGDGTFARTIVQLSSALHLATVAEGIETREQALHLLEAGCPLGQGYFYAQPLAAEAITDTLLKQGLAKWQLPLGMPLTALSAPAAQEQLPAAPQANAAA